MFKKIVNGQLAEKRKTAGFTLVEIMLVLAISGSLAAVVLFGQGQIKQKTQFSDGVEQAKNAIIKAKNEANTTVNEGGGGGANDSNVIFWGKQVVFNNNSSTITVNTLVLYKGATVPCGGSAPKICQAASYTASIPWGVTYTSTGSTGSQIFFVRSQVNGELQTYTQAPSNIADPTSYDSSTQTAKVYKLTDPIGSQATITVDPTSGSVTRVYN